MCVCCLFETLDNLAVGHARTEGDGLDVLVGPCGVEATPVPDGFLLGEEDEGGQLETVGSYSVDDVCIILVAEDEGHDGL